MRCTYFQTFEREIENLSLSSRGEHFFANSLFGRDHRRSATATAKTLDAVTKRVSVVDPEAVKVLGIVNPLAGCLVKNEDVGHFDLAVILRQLRACSQRLMRKHECRESSRAVQTPRAAVNSLLNDVGLNDIQASTDLFSPRDGRTFAGE